MPISCPLIDLVFAACCLKCHHLTLLIHWVADLHASRAQQLNVATPATLHCTAGYDVLVENLTDPAHFPHAHHKLNPMIDRNKAKAMPLTVSMINSSDVAPATEWCSDVYVLLYMNFMVIAIFKSYLSRSAVVCCRTLPYSSSL